MKMSRFNVEHSDDGATLIMNARGGRILSLNREYTEKYQRVLQGDYEGADDLISRTQTWRDAHRRQP